MTKNFNQTTNGGSPQVNQGQEGGTATNITNNNGGGGGGEPWKEPFVELQDQVAEKPWPEETPSEVTEKYETPSLALSAAVEEIETELDIETTDADPVEFEAKQKGWGETFAALVPMGVKLGSAVGMALANHAVKKTAAGVAAEAFFSTITELNS